MKKKLNLSLDPELIKAAKIQALQEDISLSEKVAELLQVWLRESAEQAPPSSP